MLNLSSLINGSGQGIEPQKIYLSDIISRYCIQVDRIIIIGLMLILTFYIINNLILPISRQGYISISHLIGQTAINRINKAFDMLYHAIDVMGLMAIFYIIWIYQQSTGLGYIMYIWGGILAVFVVLGAIIKWRSLE